MAKLLDYNYIAKLVEQVKLGDDTAFTELYTATYQKQYIFAYNYLRDEYLAQDAIQEAYILAYKNINSLSVPSLFVSWLNQINFRVCYNMQKKLMINHAQTESISEDMPATSYIPEEEAISIDRRNYVLKQVMALPYSESQAIFLRFYRNMSIKDIAYIMEMSPSTVKRYLKSGRQRLAKSLKY